MLGAASARAPRSPQAAPPGQTDSSRHPFGIRDSASTKSAACARGGSLTTRAIGA
jgi:hypothetical protein